MTPFERDYVALMQAALDAPEGLEAHRQADAVLLGLINELVYRVDQGGDTIRPHVNETMHRYHAAVARDTKAAVFHVVVGEGIEEALTPEKAREIAAKARGLRKQQIADEVEAVEAAAKALEHSLRAEIKHLVAELQAERQKGAISAGQEKP